MAKNFKDEKNFKTKLKLTFIPYPAVHNIIRGTETDKASFLIRVYLYNLFMVQKKLSQHKALAVPLSNINHNTAISPKTLYNKYNLGFYDDDYHFGGHDNKFEVIGFNRPEGGSKLIIASPKEVDTSLNTFRFTLRNPAQNTLIPIKDEKYKEQAKKYFTGKLVISGDFQKILWQKSVSTKELRILFAVLRKTTNQRIIPALDLKYFERFTGMKGYLIRDILKSLKNKNLIHCDSIDDLRKGNLVSIFVDSAVDSSQKKHINRYVVNDI